MCISKNASITSFIIGIIGSILLYYFGNKKNFMQTEKDGSEVPCNDLI